MLKIGERAMILRPHAMTLGLDLIHLLELRQQESRVELARQIGRADIDPGVFVDPALQELGAVRSLLPQDVGAVDEALVIDQQSTPFARDEILGFVKAHGRKVPDAAERTVLVLRRDALRGVLQHEEAVPLRDVHDLVHGTADTRVVNRDDGLGLLRDGRFDQAFVDVERVGPDIDKNRHGTA